jgi:murein DD-endopeptidase MepM/ murein hydrolase activator NlpD
VAKKGYTFIIVSPKLTRIKKYFVSMLFLKLLAFSLFLILLGLSYTLYNRIQLKNELFELDLLKQEKASHLSQIQWFAVQINDLKDNLAHLKAFERKLSIISNFQSPTPHDVLSGVGGSLSDKSLLSFHFDQGHEKLIDDLRLEIRQLNEEFKRHEESLHELNEYIQGKKFLLARTPAIWPTRGWVTAGFGYRISPLTGLKEFHPGLDIAAKMGTPIIAPSDGVVASIGMKGGYGKMLIIDHGYGFITRYGHISKAKVKVGSKVKRGQTIATVGNTGRSTGPHLHYEVKVKGIAVNPERYILD